MLKRTMGNAGFPADAKGLPLQYSPKTTNLIKGKLVFDSPLEVAELLLVARDIVNAKFGEYNYRPILVFDFGTGEDSNLYMLLPAEEKQRREYITFIQKLLSGENYNALYQDFYGVSVKEEQKELLKDLKSMLFG